MLADPAHALATYIHSARYDDLPSSTLSTVRADIFDTLGCALGGTSAPGIAILQRLLNRWGGALEAGVLLSDVRLPATQAALLHATMAHALDFDDSLDRAGYVHPGAPVFGACLAVSDLVPFATGKDFLVAAAVGLEIACRVGLASTVDRGWHRTATMGIFGASAAAAKLLELSEDQLVNACGIAFSQAAGEGQSTLDGALTKRLQAGQAASSGVFAAMLARDGFTGPRNIFSGKHGFFALYQPDASDPAQLTERLGEVWRCEELSFKPYPCGRILHPAIDAALHLWSELDLGKRTVAIVDLRIAIDAVTYNEQFESGPHKRSPTQIIEAQFALPFLLATALRRGKVGLAELADRQAEDVLELSGRIRGEPVSDRPRGWATLHLTLADACTRSIEIGPALGSPQNPLSESFHDQKFRACAAQASRPLSKEHIDRIIETVKTLDELPAASALLRIVNESVL